MTITARVSASVQNCAADYSVVFAIKNPPGGFVNLSYTWHLTTKTVSEGPTGMKEGSTTETTSESSPQGSSGRVYVTWTAPDGSSGTSTVVPVTINCRIT
jgi:hypothetical protein